MLYKRDELRKHNQQEGIIAIQRYLHKITKKETGKLLPHECDYLSVRLRSIFKYDGEIPTYELMLDPYDQPFLSQAIFKYLILVYFQNLDFLQPVYDGSGELPIEKVQRDKSKFYELLPRWRRQLHSGKVDRLMHEVRLEHLRKLSIVERLRKNGAYGWFLYQRKCLEQELMAFYVYITVKTFFKNVNRDCLDFVIGEHRFVANSYTYVHIVSRHYIRLFNGIDTERSFNNTLPFIDPFNLPISLTSLLSLYFSKAPAAYIFNSEYMIFDFKGDYYIIWWKRKTIAEINNQTGFEIRTLYKIESAIDRSRIPRKTIIQIDDNLNFYY